MGRVEGNISGRTSEARLHLVPVGESIESPTTQEPVSRREIRFFGKEVQIATPTFEAPSSPEKATRTEVEGIVFLVPV